MKHRIEFIPMTHLDDFFIGIMTTPDAEDEYGICRMTEFGFFLFKISIFSYKKENFNNSNEE
jgi:hypothetical protein